MKIAIVYFSYHHMNTKKVVEAISSKYNDVATFDGIKDKEIDLSSYDVIGIASGIAFSNMYPQALDFMANKLPNDKKVFFIYTCGFKAPGYLKSAKKITLDKNCDVVSSFGCRGYDTYVFKKLGGIAKKHPNNRDIEKAIKFFEKKINN